VHWETELSVAGASAILLEDEVLVFSGYRVNSSVLETTEPDLNVGRINTRDGGIEWERELVARGGSPSFKLIGSIILVAHGAALEALDARTGRYLWGAAFQEAPVFTGGTTSLVVLVLPDGIVNARDSRTGRSVWTIDSGDWTWERLHSHEGELYAIGTSGGEIGVFLATYPSASPIWSDQLSGEAGLTWEVGDELYGRVGGSELRRVHLRNGTPIGEPVEGLGRWTGHLRLESQNVQGLVLRMQRVEAYTADNPDEPIWSATLPSTSEFGSMRSVLADRGIFLESAASSVLIDAATGEVVWRVPSGQNDGRCRNLGTTGHALLRSCVQLSSSRVLAAEIEH
jgi:hypothetical protein